MRDKQLKKELIEEDLSYMTVSTLVDLIQGNLLGMISSLPSDWTVVCFQILLEWLILSLIPWVERCDKRIAFYGSLYLTIASCRCLRKWCRRWKPAVCEKLSAITVLQDAPCSNSKAIVAVSVSRHFTIKHTRNPITYFTKKTKHTIRAWSKACDALWLNTTPYQTLYIWVA